MNKEDWKEYGYFVLGLIGFWAGMIVLGMIANVIGGWQTAAIVFVLFAYFINRDLNRRLAASEERHKRARELTDD